MPIPSPTVLVWIDRGTRFLFLPVAVLALVLMALRRSRAPDLLGHFSLRYAALLCVFALGLTLLGSSALPRRTRLGRIEKPGLGAAVLRAAAVSGAFLVFSAYLAVEYLEVATGIHAFITLPPLLLGILILPCAGRARLAMLSVALGSAVFFHCDHLLLLAGFTAASLGGLALAIGAARTLGTGPLDSPRSDLLSRPATGRWARPLLLCWGSACFAILVSEAFLLTLRGSGLIRAGGVLPKEYELRRVEGSRDYYWHGTLHHFNRQGFRGDDQPEAVRTTRDVYRIVVLGDSLTYGYGVAERDTYTEVLRRGLDPGYRVEVFNLGVSGAQSEDIVKIASEYLPRLRPDLVLYGHCLNDFLPSGVGEYSQYNIPLPFRLKQFFRRRTLIGGLADNGYSKLLIALGLERDFFADILEDLGNNALRFTNDMKALNRLALQTTGLPVLSLVLNQYPQNPQGRRVARLAEERMSEAGMTVIPADPYQDEYAASGVQLNVSIWEGHPNRLAHSIFAGEFQRAMLANPGIRQSLERVRR